jgi:HEPN domain-containing protein
MTPHELRLRRVEGFWKIAAEELRAAKLLSGEHRPQAAYFLQQTVEKLARGLLEIDDIPVGPTHQIHQLSGMMKGRNELAFRFAKLDELSSAATKFRYPGPTGNISDISEQRLAILMGQVESLHLDVSAILSDFLRGNAI